MTFVLDAYAARSCPVKTFNTFSPHVEQPPELMDEPPEQFLASRQYRQHVQELAAELAADVIDLRSINPSSASQEQQAEATIQALHTGTSVLLNAVLPPDPVGHRSGRAGILIKDPRSSGYWPVQIKPYRVLERQTGASHLMFSELAQPAQMNILHGMRYRLYREGALLEVAHLWRMLERAGYAAGTPWGGIVGDGSEDETPQITWVNLTHRFIRTFARTSTTRHKTRSALERYDHEHSFRIHVAQRAIAGVDPDKGPVRPIRIPECESCPWRSICLTRMDHDDLSLRLNKSPLDVRELQTLMGLGIHTIDELAQADIEAILPQYLALTGHRDRSEQRLWQAARRARMIQRGVYVERFTDQPITTPRSDIEIDLDIETSDRDVTYLWGVLITDRITGKQQYRHFSEFMTLTPDAEEKLAAEFARWLLEMVRTHPSLRVYHYSDYETVHLKRLAHRSNNADLIEALELIPTHFVDLFQTVREHYVGVDGLGLKVVATQGAGFSWRDEEPGGLNSRVWFADAIGAPSAEQRAAARQRVLDYNEDDVRATWAVREWMERAAPSQH